MEASFRNSALSPLTLSGEAWAAVKELKLSY